MEKVNSGYLKVKVFSDALPQLEKDVNDWLLNEKVAVRTITQSESAGENGHVVTITIWYSKN
ncbi:MAG: hypothetical protein GY795_50655 [Desulfobacterales bacterium]|nr:hypothetical protein [Desulfobacterales bacterium]